MYANGRRGQNKSGGCWRIRSESGATGASGSIDVLGTPQTTNSPTVASASVTFNTTITVNTTVSNTMALHWVGASGPSGSITGKLSRFYRERSWGVTRTMADAETGNAQAALDAGTTLVAGYVTGTSSVQWTAAQLAARVTIERILGQPDGAQTAQPERERA
jgi:hypothetical protein